MHFQANEYRTWADEEWGEFKWAVIMRLIKDSFAGRQWSIIHILYMDIWTEV